MSLKYMQERVIFDQANKVYLPSRIVSYANWKIFYSTPQKQFGKLADKVGKSVHEMTDKDFIEALRKEKGLPEEPRVCPICNGDLIVHEKNLGVVYCMCYVVRWMREAGSVLDPYRSAVNQSLRIGNFSTKINGYSSTLTDARNRFLEFVNSPEKWIFIFGNTGSGKSHLLQATASALSPIALYITAYDIARYARDIDGNIERAISTIERAPILILDDYGIQKDTEWLTSMISRIIDFRYIRRFELPTIVSSNYNLSQISMIDQRIASRLSDIKLVDRIDFSQIPDYRTNGNGA